MFGGRKGVNEASLLRHTRARLQKNDLRSLYFTILTNILFIILISIRCYT